mmetsp:Transcript_7523/g.16360  ORF Transcript_7523/g.16360 Transcript_7523/m.16360 type:complete len:247 (+) Transcript_7523:463-1203(+)
MLAFFLASDSWPFSGSQSMLARGRFNFAGTDWRALLTESATDWRRISGWERRLISFDSKALRCSWSRSSVRWRDSGEAEATSEAASASPPGSTSRPVSRPEFPSSAAAPVGGTSSPLGVTSPTVVVPPSLSLSALDGSSLSDIEEPAPEPRGASPARRACKSHVDIPTAAARSFSGSCRKLSTSFMTSSPASPSVASRSKAIVGKNFAFVIKLLPLWLAPSRELGIMLSPPALPASDTRSISLKAA